MSALINAQNNIYWYYAKEDELRNPADIRSSVPITDSDGMSLGIERRPPIYSDQLLPFDITITAHNEYGQMAVQRIFGVEILNAGAGLSVDDIVHEQQATWVARSMTQFTPIEFPSNQNIDTAAFYNRAQSILRGQAAALPTPSVPLTNAV